MSPEVNMRLLYARGRAAVDRGMHLGPSTAPDERRELGIVRIGS